MLVTGSQLPIPLTASVLEAHPARLLGEGFKALKLGCILETNWEDLENLTAGSAPIISQNLPVVVL